MNDSSLEPSSFFSSDLPSEDPSESASVNLIDDLQIALRAVLLCLQIPLMVVGAMQFIRLRLKTGSFFYKPLVAKKLFHVFLFLCMGCKTLNNILKLKKNASTVDCLCPCV